MIRVGDYGIDSDNLNYILMVFGTKERRLKEGETPREVVKETMYFSTFKNLQKAMVEHEIRVNIASAASVEEAYFSAFDKLGDIILKLIPTVKGRED